MASLVDWRRVTGQTEQSESKEHSSGRGQLAGIRAGFMWDALKLEGRLGVVQGRVYKCLLHAWCDFRVSTLNAFLSPHLPALNRQLVLAYKNRRINNRDLCSHRCHLILCPDLT